MAPSEVTFLSSNLKLSAHLYVPDSYKTGERLPAIVVVHPGGGVKEQTAGLYAKELSRQGFITLAFDRRTQGASEGTPRCVEDPYAAAEDVKSAVTYLTLNEKVDASRIGVLGICAGGGYSIFAASTDRRIKAVGTVSMVCVGGMFTAIPKENLDALLVQSGEARTEYAKTGEVKYLPYLPALDQITDDSPVLMREGADYYLTPRGGHPRSVNRFAVWSYDILTAYDSFAKIENISPRPLLLVAGTAADTLQFSEQAQEAERRALSKKGTELAQREIEKLQEQIALMRSNLEDFVHDHQKDIRNNPDFRVKVQRMCQLLGVDPLVSRKGYMAELLGVGDFYCELGIQIIDICVSTRAINGGIMELNELKDRLVKRRIKNTGESIVEDDIRRAIKQLGPLKGGYKIVNFGDKKMVQSIAKEMNSDHSTCLALAQHTGKFSFDDVSLAFGWEMDRINACIDDMLRSGIIWLDECPGSQPEFYVPAFFSFNGQRLA
ncbi:hypothetical protein GGI12_004841 [Dipsacomyces acuminosporus]|nr:hypothetical protein GGI12_004841 [Dipsacomyces acuminosporus]